MEIFLIENDTFIIWLTAIILFAVFGIPFWIKKIRLEKHTDIQDIKAERYGLKEPISLYPKVDPNICIGTGGCIAACPEQDVLGLRNGQGVAINKAHCVGHGLCERSCPVDAITLVFGSETRGVDIPRIQENFETNIDGIYIVGELGGMGLIRNAFEQGRQCIDYISKSMKQDQVLKQTEMLDLVIIGCGPAGLSATIHANRLGLKFLTLEREDVGGTVRYYPRKKLVMTQPLKVPGIGKIHKKEIEKEELIDLWNEIIQTHDLSSHIKTEQSVDRIISFGEGHRVVTKNGEYVAKRVILAIGRRGTPRKLNIPGENLSNVVYNLLEPDHFQNEHITVVGGGDSAVEAAISLSEQIGNHVSLSYRNNKFARLKATNLKNLNEAVEQGAIELLLNSNVIENAQNELSIQCNDGEIIKRKNDRLFIFAGGVLPDAFLKDIGIKVDTKFGHPK